MFCGCPARFGGEPNSLVCPVCLGLPGSLPVTNRAAIEYTIRIGLALNCTIADWCRFARKNYFYPDMPKNFQISQYDEPLCTNGWLDVVGRGPGADGGARQVRVGIERVHLEEDTGKSLHVGGATGRIHGADYSLVDYNRAGIPLVEVVTKPIEGTGALAPAVAHTYVSELRDLMRALAVSDVRMEEGSLRADVNISLSPRGSGGVGNPDRDQERQLAALGRAGGPVRDRAAGGRAGRGRPVALETRHFHEDTGVTTAGRSKEEAQDYRYFPEPDLVPVAPSREWVEQIRAALPELPLGPAGAAGGRVGAVRPSTSRRYITPVRSTWSRETVAAGRVARRRPQVVAERAGAPGQRVRHRPRRPAHHARRRGPGGGPGGLR